MDVFLAMTIGKIAKLFLVLMIFLIVVGCEQVTEANTVPGNDITPSVIASTSIPEEINHLEETVLPTEGINGIVESTPQKLIAPRPTLGPDDWKQLPVVPVINETVFETYKLGQKLGNDPNAFSKIGDCESVTEWFLADFDKGEAYYSLGEYTELEDVIEYFKGSYRRLGQAAKPGFTAASLMTPLWANREQCEKDESPLACEFRLHRPSFVLITLGTNDVANPDTFEGNLRRLIEYTLEQGVVPVLSTKADNLEGDHRINATIAKLAFEYDLPLWNFWAAVQSLPDHGLQDDGAHLSFGPNRFDDPSVMKQAWPIRNLTALQVLDALRIAVSEIDWQ